MSTYFILTFRDIKANMYLPPLHVPNIQAAIREIRDEVNRKDSNLPWARWPEDHELWRLGTWESENATYANNEKPSQLLVLSTLRET